MQWVTDFMWQVPLSLTSGGEEGNDKWIFSTNYFCHGDTPKTKPIIFDFLKTTGIWAFWNGKKNPRLRVFTHQILFRHIFLVQPFTLTTWFCWRILRHLFLNQPSSIFQLTNQHLATYACIFIDYKSSFYLSAQRDAALWNHVSASLCSQLCQQTASLTPWSMYEGGCDRASVPDSNSKMWELDQPRISVFLFLVQKHQNPLVMARCRLYYFFHSAYFWRHFFPPNSGFSVYIFNTTSSDHENKIKNLKNWTHCNEHRC